MDIFTAIAHGRVRQISNMLQQNSACIHLRTHDEKTPLIFTVCEAQEDIRTHLLRMLIRNGSDVNACDNCGRTALMYAAMDAEKIDLVRVLSRCKACDPNARDNEGNTAIVHAVMCANAKTIKVLVNASATKSCMNLELLNKQGTTALDLCVKLQMTECCRILVCEGGANARNVKNQAGLMRLLEDENLVSRTNTPHSRNPSRNAYLGRKMNSPILENKQMEGSYMTRDTTPSCYDGDVPESYTPISSLSRSNSLHRSNSNLYKRRLEAGIRPASFSSGSDVLGFLNSPRNLKRALTPITGRNGNANDLMPEIPDDRSLGRSMRLPSIPSGRKLYLVASQNNE